MKHRNSIIKKMLSAALISAFAVTPVVMEMPAAQAAPPGWTQNRNDRGRQRYERFNGRVTKIDSDRRFDIRVGSQTYNVNLSSRLPRRLSKGDEVRVTGQRYGDNDINNARVESVRNNSGNHGNRYETFTGTVTKIEHSRRFDLRANGRIYNVNTANGIIRNLRVGNVVRVYGLRFGDNDINNANVKVVRRR